MTTPLPFFEKASIAGFTRAELDAVADLVETPGWAAVKKFLDAIVEPARPAVFTNVDPDKQLLLHQGIGRIYVAMNLEEFVSSAKAQADLLMQQEQSARDDAEPTDEGKV